MTTGWFRLPETGQGTEGDPRRPDFKGYENNIREFSSNRIANSPVRITHVRAPNSVLDALTLEQGVTKLSASQAAQLFNDKGGKHVNAPDIPWDADDVNRHFNVGGN